VIKGIRQILGVYCEHIRKHISTLCINMLSFLMLQRVKRTVTTGFIKDYVNNTRRLNRASIESLIPVVYDRSQLIY
jgi:hypothetical protein